MKLAMLLSSEKWERRSAIARKRVANLIRKKCDSRPVFILGKQRSGTSMMMYTFHRHPDALVYDEHFDNAAFEDYQLRDLDIIRKLIASARFPIVCFKPICDSHKMKILHDEFPGSSLLWAYRDFCDVANSALRKTKSATRAIRLVCTGQQGGGWFEEGISPAVMSALRDVYRPDLAEFDLACLVWWARNRIVLESGLIGKSEVTLVQYEALVTNPQAMLRWLYRRLGIDYLERTARKISPRSIGRHPAPAMDSRVQELCRSTMDALDEAFHQQQPPLLPDEKHSAIQQL